MTVQKINEAVAFIKKQYATFPEAGIVLGSGLGSFTTEIKIEKELESWSHYLYKLR